MNRKEIGIMVGKKAEIAILEACQMKSAKNFNRYVGRREIMADLVREIMVKKGMISANEPEQISHESRKKID